MGLLTREILPQKAVGEPAQRPFDGVLRGFAHKLVQAEPEELPRANNAQRGLEPSGGVVGADVVHAVALTVFRVGQHLHQLWCDRAGQGGMLPRELPEDE